MNKLKNKIGFLVTLATTLTKNNKPVIYVAGKVTGLEPMDYLAKFRKAQIKLEQQGWKVLNPCEFIGPEESWETAMRLASTLLNMADTIYMLPDWEQSQGAVWEHRQAIRFGLNAIYE